MAVSAAVCGPSDDAAARDGPCMSKSASMALLADVWRLTVTSPGLTAPLLAAPPSERALRLHEQSAQTQSV